MKYACRQEREKLAYFAQRQWLALFGRDLGVQAGSAAASRAH
jgi:hypothetical protein